MSPLHEVYFAVPGSIIFFVLLAASLGIFSSRLYRLYRILKLGKPDIRWGQLWERFRVAFGRVIAQVCTLRELSPKDRSGLGHFFIFWAFILFSISYIFLVADGFSEGFSRRLLGGPVYNVYHLALEVFGLLVILAIIVAVIRRYIIRPARLSQTADAAYILSFIFLLMATSFFTEGLDLAASGTSSPWTPVAQYLSGVFSGLSSAAGLYQGFWWVHMALLLGFLAYIPYSKHLHILLSPFNIFLRSLRPEGGLKVQDYKSGGEFGVSRIEDFTWKQLLDLYTCTECGRCQENCPAALTDKVLSPKKVIVDMKEHVIEHGQQLLSGHKNGEKPPALIGEVVAEQAIWDCTTCRACQEACPVFIEHTDKIIDMRRSLVQMQSKFPEEIQPLFENTEQRSNPWGIAPAERAKWAADIQTKPFAAGQTEYLFYVGCAGAFDSRNRKKTLALASILDAAGISWGILGKDELCCGDSMRRLGNEYVFDAMARANIKMFQDKGIKKIITQCPHCFSTLKNDYRQFGADFEVVNHVELINDLIKAGRLELAQNTQVGKVVFHDSCYLGRHNNVYDAPREATAAATGLAPAEMPRNHRRSFCCGAGGGHMWMEERQGKRINVARVEEALKESPDTLCVSCPYCLIMFEDGLKETNASEKVRVLDVAEIVAGAIKQPGPQPRIETAAAH